MLPAPSQHSPVLSPLLILTTRDFGTGTRGFAASEDANVAVCVLPGTELSFASEDRESDRLVLAVGLRESSASLAGYAGIRGGSA